MYDLIYPFERQMDRTMICLNKGKYFKKCAYLIIMKYNPKLQIKILHLKTNHTKYIRFFFIKKINIKLFDILDSSLFSFPLKVAI